jgi:hypothetical protein
MRPVQALQGPRPARKAVRSIPFSALAARGLVALMTATTGVFAVACGGDGEGDQVVQARSSSGFDEVDPEPGSTDEGGLAPADDGEGDEQPRTEAATSAEPPGTPTGEPSEQTAEPAAAVDLIHGDAQPAFDALVDEVGDAQVVELVIYDTYLITEYQSAAEPENIDRVIWRDGEIEPPEPVGFTADDTMVFAPDEVDLAAIPDLADEALDEFAIDGGVVSHVIVDRFFGLEDGGVAIRVYVSHPERGGGGYLLARADGSVVRVVGS